MIIAAVAASTPPVIPNYGGPPGGKHGCIAQNGTFCWDWVKGHWGDILQPRLLEHLELTAIAVGIGFAIAFAAALLAHRRRWFETPFGAFSAFLYTIPSLALLVQESLKRDPHAGDLYVFRGRRGDLLKIIWHDGQGACLFTKRLEGGRFLMTASPVRPLPTKAHGRWACGL